MPSRSHFQQVTASPSWRSSAAGATVEIVVHRAARDSAVTVHDQGARTTHAANGRDALRHSWLGAREPNARSRSGGRSGTPTARHANSILTGARPFVAAKRAANRPVSLRAAKQGDGSRCSHARRPWPEIQPAWARSPGSRAVKASGVMRGTNLPSTADPPPRSAAVLRSDDTVEFERRVIVCRAVSRLRRPRPQPDRGHAACCQRRP